jgi:hypothetical protein
MRHVRGDSLAEIGREFGIAKYSSVSSVIERTKAIIAKDRPLRHRVEKLKEELNMSQEQTWPLYIWLFHTLKIIEEHLIYLLEALQSRAKMKSLSSFYDPDPKACPCREVSSLCRPFLRYAT